MKLDVQMSASSVAITSGRLVSASRGRRKLLLLGSDQVYYIADAAQGAVTVAGGIPVTANLLLEGSAAERSYNAIAPVACVAGVVEVLGGQSEGGS